MEATARDFFRKHKKGIIIGTTVIVVTAVTGVLVCKNWDIIRKTKVVKSVLGTATTYAKETAIGLKTTEECAIEQIPESKVINIERFIRNLPDSRNASPEKMKQAKELGIELDKHQTFVDPHIRHIA